MCCSILQAIGKLISAAGRDSRLVDADLAALRAEYRARATEVYDMEQPEVSCL